jgi:hypothetical protein
VRSDAEIAEIFSEHFTFRHMEVPLPARWADGALARYWRYVRSRL